MTETYFIGDTHFGHSNILEFTDDTGKLLRPGFACVEEMNEHIIDRWNSVVTSQDKVIHCGDVAFGKDSIQLCKRLKGTKQLVLGNHDRFGIQNYLEVFTKVYGAKYIGDNVAIVTHIPIHPSSLRRFKMNIHGHLHTNFINNWQYMNVSCEAIDYTPISLEELEYIYSLRDCDD